MHNLYGRPEYDIPGLELSPSKACYRFDRTSIQWEEHRKQSKKESGHKRYLRRDEDFIERRKLACKKYSDKPSSKFKREQYQLKTAPKHRARVKAWRAANPEKVMKISRVNSWKNQGINITWERYLELKEEQYGRCSICMRHESEFTGRTKALHVDHDHTTGEVRGLLCDTCNKAVGLFYDNPENLHSAYCYLMSFIQDKVK